MNLDYCREIVELARRLNFTETAEALYLSRPALSKHVSLVEQEVGFKVFERDTSRVSLTERGRILVEGLTEMLDTYRRTLLRTSALDEEPDAPVRICGPLLYCPLAPQLLEAAKTSGLSYVPVETGIRDSDAFLLEGEADVALGLRLPNTSEQIVATTAGHFSIVAIVSGQSPLANTSGPINLSDFSDMRLLSYPVEGREKYWQHFKKLVEIQCPSAELASFLDSGVFFPNFVDEACLVLSFPRYMLLGDAGSVMLPIVGLENSFELCVMRRADESRQEVLDMYELLCQSLANNPLT